MGSAVSAASSAIGGVLGGGIQGITSNVIPGANLANSAQANNQIGALQAQSANLQNNYQQQNTGALQQKSSTENTIAGAQGLLGNANAVNQGGNVQNALGLLQAQANGTAPSAAQGVLQQGTDQAIATQAALANSGNLSQMISGQKTAMDNAANLIQQSANQASQLRANQQQTGQQNYAAAAGQQAAQAGTNASTANAIAGTNLGLLNTENNYALGTGQLANNTATNAGNIAVGGQGIQQGALNQAQGQQANAAGGALNGIGGILSSGLLGNEEEGEGGGNIAGAAAGIAGLFSDADQKQNISSDRSSRASATTDYFKSQNAKDDMQDEKPKEEPKKDSSYSDDDPRKAFAKEISESFSTSDENSKKAIHKEDSLIHKFLDAIDPVTFDYKSPDGIMGRTPGKHMGVIAQQVEKAPGGKSMVKDTSEGKVIDLASAVGALMSAAADAHDRISTVEELFKARRGKK